MVVSACQCILDADCFSVASAQKIPPPRAGHAVSRQMRAELLVLWLQERVGLFRRWVQAQPEQVIVAFGHSSMIKELSGGKRLRNCELLTMQL